MKRTPTRIHGFSAFGTTLAALTALTATGCSGKRAPTRYMSPSGNTGASSSPTAGVHDPSVDDLSADEANLANLGFVMKRAVDGQGMPYYMRDASREMSGVKNEDLVAALDRYRQDLQNYILKRPTDPGINDLKAKLECVRGELLRLTGGTGPGASGPTAPSGSGEAGGVAGSAGSSKNGGPASSGGLSPGANNPSMPPDVGTTPTVSMPPATPSWPGTTPPTCGASDGCPRGGSGYGAPAAGQGMGQSMEQGKGNVAQSLNMGNVIAAENALSQVGLTFELTNGFWGFRSDEYHQYAMSHPDWKSRWLAALQNYQLSASDYLQKYGDLTTQRDTTVKNKLAECERTIATLTRGGSGS